MINNIKNLIFILILFTVSLSSPIENITGEVINPFLIINNPSLLSCGDGLSFGTQGYVSSDLKDYSLTTGFSTRVNKSGYSLLYYKNYKGYDYNISTAFSTSLPNFSFGATTKFLVDNKELFFTVDAAASYLFNINIYAGILLKNIFTIDTLNTDYPREFTINSGGKIPKIKRFYFDFKAKLFLYTIKNSEIGFGSYLSLNKLLFKNPSLILYGSGDLVYDYNKNISVKIESGLGINIKDKNFKLDIYVGDRYNYTTSNIEIYSSIVLKPKIKIEIEKLSANIKVVEKNKLLESSFDNVIISINGNFSNEKTALKRWSMFIYKKDLLKNTIIKTFSGGNIPPSSIKWDYRDSKGEIINKGEYFAKIVLIDKLNRSFKSKSIKVNFNY